MMTFNILGQMESEFYSLKEAACIFNVHVNTIRRAISRGYLIAIRVGAGKRSPYRISKKSIDMIHSSIIFGHNQKAMQKKENQI